MAIELVEEGLGLLNFTPEFRPYNLQIVAQ